MKPVLPFLRNVASGRRALLLAFPLAVAGATRIPWADLTEADWIYALATRFAVVDGHRVHYPTPTVELARLLEARAEPAALRHLAEARLELGDRPGALAAMERWAAAQGPQAWAETARWAQARREMPAAFRAAEKALPGLPEEEKRALADERIRWADRFPEHADPVAMRKARADAFPADPVALEDWLRALEKAGRLEEADRALAASRALDEERRLLLRSDLQADHRNPSGALRVLDEAVVRTWSMDFRRAYARRVEAATPSSPAAWRATLDKAFDAGALARFATFLQGQGRGDAALDLLRQVERRHHHGLQRDGWLLLARLYSEIDAVPEAFKATLAAAQAGSAEEQKGDLAALARLALRAGARPLALGSYNDEAYRWVARVDRTPGFWTGGVSFLLTGFDGREALARLETDSVPDRTFALARKLTDELAGRAPGHPELPSLRVAIMQRHVERGEGRAALALLPGLESGPPAAADEARRIALQAMRQTQVPLAEEVRLMKARLRFRAADGSRPRQGSPATEIAEEGEADPRPWARLPKGSRPQGYPDLLQECISRLEHRDRTHQSSLALILGELDRLPAAEELWLDLASRLEGWNLDDDLGPRFEQALQRFKGSGVWARAARWYARRNRHVELRGLAESLAARFRAADAFARADGAASVRLQIPDQPTVGGRVRLVPWADWVRFKALERFPHSPKVFQEAQQRLVTESRWRALEQAGRISKDGSGPVVVPDALMTERRWAVLFADAAERERYFADQMRAGRLDLKLAELERKPDRTPVEELILFDGWSRLSKFEQAVPAADRLVAAYPGDGMLAQRVLSLHRSLNGLDAAHAESARALVSRTAPALEDPAPLWTELGELEEERGQPQRAKDHWRNLLARDPRNPARISELATLLWDYGHDAEALKVVEDGRKAIGRPRFFAFETGVLRENLKDADGAVREYLDALRPEAGTGYSSAFEQDQRSLRRLAQLLGRPRVYRVVEQRIQGLRPGMVEDERTLAAFFPMATIQAPAPGLGWDADDWIDAMDLPNDPVGRAERAARMGQARPAQYDGISRIGEVLLQKAHEMAGKASTVEFLDCLRNWGEDLAARRWPKERCLDFRHAILARGAQLAADEGARIRLEIARARFLAENGRSAAADAVWTALEPRIGALPEGSARLRAEAERAGYLERAKGVATATAEWRRLTGKYAWSLGLLEDRLAFLQRTGQGEEGRRALEEIAPRAATGHREALLERLTRDCLAAPDLPRARRALEKWLSEPGLTGPRRLQALHLLARLSIKENPGWDPFPLAKAESGKLQEAEQADLWQQLARAADHESAPALALWIEALNRRTDREWLAAACRSAERAGKGGELLGFFEKQLQRSPRDVRWAVAVRDIRRALHLVEGALQAAKAAVAVRPEREQLWREAADLLVRADRVKEAADYLDGWNRPRPADEGTARWRSELYARAGDGERALAIERAALEAFRRERPEDRDELAERRARATLRLLELGLPNLSLRLHGAGTIQSLAGSRVPVEKQAEIALLTNQFPQLLGRIAGQAEAAASVASVLRERGRPEHRDEVQTFLLRQILPPGAAQPEAAALARWWPFAEQAGLEPQLRFALAEALRPSRPGPWQAAAPPRFLEAVGAACVVARKSAGGPETWTFQEPDWSKLWTRDLARRDRGEELVAFLEPRWQELLAQVKGTRPLDASSERLPWAAWFDDALVLQAWSRAAATRPEKVRELAEILSERRLWDRFWVLAARKWQAAPLVALLPQSARGAWFAFWEPALPSEPALLARRRATDAATAALARLVQGAPSAAEDPLIVKLRGPQTVGDILGRDARWTWPEFALRRDVRGELLEKGDDRVLGSGVDAGRLPGALWGDRPGEAWYVLETLARYRRKDPSALRVPLEVPQRGGETDRLLLAMRLARGLGRSAEALELDAEHPASGTDRRRLEAKLLQLLEAARRADALEAWKAFLRRGQGTLSEAEFVWHATLAESQGLPSPLQLLDAGSPLAPALLAYLVDVRPESAGVFRTEDPTGFRLALANRWRARQAELSAEQVRRWLKELWAQGAAPLPVRGLAKLGGAWPHAAEWLERRPAGERLPALAALESAAAPGTPLPEPFARPADEPARLLALRLRLLRGEGSQAQAMLDSMLEEQRRSEALGLPSDALESSPPPVEQESQGGEEDAPPPVPVATSGDPLVERLEAWLRPFRDVRRADLAEPRLAAFLRERRSQGPLSTAAWRLAFRVADPESRAALGEDLEKAWFRGEVQPDQIGALGDALAAALPGDIQRWLSRWPRSHGFGHARQLAAILATAKLHAAATAVLAESRRRKIWRGEEEFQAFDLWRRLGSAVGPEARPPASWTAALTYWTGKAGTPLLQRLREHPHDILSARAVLRSPAQLDEDTLLRVELAQSATQQAGAEDLLLRLKAARGLLPNGRAAAGVLGSAQPEAYRRMMVDRRMKSVDINAALADLARIAALEGNDGRARNLLAMLGARRAPGLQALHAELAKVSGENLEAFRLVEGRPAPLRPRDLTWAVVAKVLTAEGVR